MQNNAPWYRHLWVWLIMLPPLAAVVGGIATLVIATTGADEVIRDDYVKVGLELREDTSKREAAAAMGLGANVHLLRGDGRVTVIVRSGEQMLPESLVLRLVHPTDSRHDLEAPLLKVGNIYRADLGQPAAGRWVVQIEPDNQAWRLAGELPAEASALALGTGS